MNSPRLLGALLAILLAAPSASAGPPPEGELAQNIPGSIDAITLEGDQLFVQSTGEPKVAIFAETANVFFAKGQPWRLVFGMGPQGKAIQLTFRQNGQEYTAKRLD